MARSGNSSSQIIFPQGDTGKLPIELDISTRKTSALGKIFVGVFIFVAAMSLPDETGIFGGAEDMIALIYRYVPLGLMVVALGAVVIGVLDFITKNRVTITSDAVRFSSKNVLRSKAWSESLAAYDGVRWRKIVVVRSSASSGVSSSSTTYQILELKHKDDRRTIPLFTTTTGDDTRAMWEHFAKLFNLPAIDERDGESRTRAVEDLDKSIKDLAAEGKVNAEWNDIPPPPAGLSMAKENGPKGGEGDTILVTILAKRAPAWLYGLLLGIGGLIFVYALTSFTIMGMLVGAGLAAGVVWIWKAETANPRTIRITRTDIAFDQPMAGTGAKESVFMHADIESIIVRKREDIGFLGRVLVVSTDHGELTFAGGVSDKGLAWLERLLVSAIANA